MLFARLESNTSVYKLLVAVGVVVIFIESFFIINHINSVEEFRTSLHKLKVTSHSINHMLYPLAYFLGLSGYIYVEENTVLSIILSCVTCIVFIFHYLYLPRHLSSGHIDEAISHKVSAKVDFVLYIFKFFSYFIIHLGLFQAHIQLRISLDVIFLINFLVNFCFLYAHIYRKKNVSVLNVFMVVLFSLVTSLFVLYSRLPTVNYSASVATLIFYLSSGVFYHKLDGSLNYKVVLEYGSLAVILSVFLFAT
jgi:hypothetical protein